MNPYLSEKARGEVPRVLKWLRNAGLAFCVFCSVGGLYTLCLSLQEKDYSHIGGYFSVTADYAQLPTKEEKDVSLDEADTTTTDTTQTAQ